MIVSCNALVTLFTMFCSDWNFKMTHSTIFELDERKDISSVIIIFLFNNLHVGIGTRSLSHIRVFAFRCFSHRTGRCCSWFFNFIIFLKIKHTLFLLRFGLEFRYLKWKVCFGCHFCCQHFLNLFKSFISLFIMVFNVDL